MLKYSLDGFINSIRIKKRPALIVEGKHDEIVLDRLVSHLQRRGIPCTVEVMNAELIKDCEGAAGNREKAEMALVKAGLHSLDAAAFVDREYRGFSSTNYNDEIGKHRVSGTLYWTRGHSIECYYLTDNCFRMSIEFFSPKISTLLSSESIVGLIDGLLPQAAALSIALYEHSLIHLSVGLVTKECWDQNPGAAAPALNNIWGNRLRERGGGGRTNC